MKHVKTLALAAVAAGALMAFVGAGTASATVICSTTADPCTSPWANQTMDLSLIGSSVLKEPGPEGETLNTCNSGTIKGTMTNGTSTATASVAVKAENLTWGGCTSTSTAVTGPSLEVHKIAGTSNGTVTASGLQFTVFVAGLLTCIFETGEGSHLGTLTEGKAAVLHVEARLTGIGIGCPAEVEWSATYLV